MRLLNATPTACMHLQHTVPQATPLPLLTIVCAAPPVDVHHHGVQAVERRATAAGCIHAALSHVWRQVQGFGEGQAGGDLAVPAGLRRGGESARKGWGAGCQGQQPRTLRKKSRRANPRPLRPAKPGQHPCRLTAKRLRQMLRL